MLYLQMLKDWLDARIDWSDERGEITEKVLSTRVGVNGTPRPADDDGEVEDE